MNRTCRMILGVLFVAVMLFSAITLVQNLTRSWRADVTQEKLYTLSDGTRAILAKLNQPLTIKYFYAKTAAMKAPDQIRLFNNYHQFVLELLEEYAATAQGKLKLDVVDPRPFSGEEEDALRFGLKKFPITEEENFFFGLVVQTQFGVNKSIPFFSPDRQNFVEYDISQLIDSAIRRQKQRVGVMSSLPIMGEDTQGYMAQMKQMQGQQLEQPWAIVQQLKQTYDVKEIKTDVEEIKREDVDVLLVVHPKDLPAKGQFAIDQFILNGGHAIVCLDPHAFVDQPDQTARMSRQPHNSSSNLPELMKVWGLEMLDKKFAGDRDLAVKGSLQRNQPPGPIIGFLNLEPDKGCFDEKSVISANLKSVRMFMGGVLQQTQAPEGAAFTYTSLMKTSNRGNAWQVSNPYEMMMPDPQRWLKYFTDGSQPVVMAYLVSGRFRSAFPNGVDVEEAAKEDTPDQGEKKDGPTKTKHLAGLTEAKDEGAVVVFADVDFLSDMIAYQQSFFGYTPAGDNAACLQNAIDSLSGSNELIMVRSRGNFQRPFSRVDAIEQAAEKDTAKQVDEINAKIEGYQKELEEIASKAKNIEEVISSAAALDKKRNVEANIRQAKRSLREVNLKRSREIEAMGLRLSYWNMLTAPAAILVIAIVLSVVRAARRRRSISHASDA